MYLKIQMMIGSDTLDLYLCDMLRFSLPPLGRFLQSVPIQAIKWSLHP